MLSLVKMYRLCSTYRTLELGKRGVTLESQDNHLLVKGSNNSLTRIKLLDAQSGDEAVTLSQLQQSQASVQSTYSVLDTNSSLNINIKYYIIDDVTLTLPDTTTVAVGESIAVRTKTNTVVTIILHNDTNEDIITSAGTTKTLIIDEMSDYVIVYSGDNTWEML